LFLVVMCKLPVELKFKIKNIKS